MEQLSENRELSKNHVSDFLRLFYDTKVDVFVETPALILHQYRILKGIAMEDPFKELNHSVPGSCFFFAKKKHRCHLNVFPSWLGVRG